MTISLDASQQRRCSTGDTVSVTLPDGTTTPGVISSVGKVATTGSGGSATITGAMVAAGPPEGGRGAGPGAGDGARSPPGSVRERAGGAGGRAAGPAGGGYAVEVAGAGGRHHLVPVSAGVFDDAAGLVQVTGSGLAAGQHVVVPAL